MWGEEGGKAEEEEDLFLLVESATATVGKSISHKRSAEMVATVPGVACRKERKEPEICQKYPKNKMPSK